MKSKLSSQMTEVRTGYARICIFLLAINLLLTGYCIVKLTAPEAQATQAIIESEQTE